MHGYGILDRKLCTDDECYQQAFTDRFNFLKTHDKESNWWLVGAFFATTALSLAAVYIPGLKMVFGLPEDQVFSPVELAISAGLAFSTVPVVEIGKIFRRLHEKQKKAKLNK